VLVRQKHKQQCQRDRHAACFQQQWEQSHKPLIRHHDGTPGEGAESTDAMVLLFVVVHGLILDESGLAAVDFT
jgi:hypothetical protein